MKRSSARTSVEHGDATLMKDSVGRLGSLGMAVGVMAPTGGLAFFFGVTAIFVGESGPLVMLVGTIVGIIVALVFAAFARRMSSASSLYMFNGRSLGVGYGFVSAWVMMLAYILFAAAICPYENTFTAQIWAPLGDIPATLTGIITLGLAAFLSFRGVRISTYLVAIVEFVGVGTAIIVGLAVIAHGGYGGHRLGFYPYFGLNGLSLSGFAFGVAFAFSGLAGFDSAANLGEESRPAPRTHPDNDRAGHGGNRSAVHLWLLDADDGLPQRHRPGELAHPPDHRGRPVPVPVVRARDSDGGDAEPVRGDNRRAWRGVSAALRARPGRLRRL